MWHASIAFSHLRNTVATNNSERLAMVTTTVFFLLYIKSVTHLERFIAFYIIYRHCRRQTYYSKLLLPEIYRLSFDLPFCTEQSYIVLYLLLPLRINPSTIYRQRPHKHAYKSDIIIYYPCLLVEQKWQLQEIMLPVLRPSWRERMRAEYRFRVKMLDMKSGSCQGKISLITKTAV